MLIKKRCFNKQQIFWCDVRYYGVCFAVSDFLSILSSESPSPSQVQKSSPKVKSKVKSKVRSWKDLGLSPRTWTLLTLLSLLHTTTTTTTHTKLFRHFQRPYHQVLYLFGNLSWPLTWITTQMQDFCKFFATLFCKPSIWTLKKSYSESPITSLNEESTTFKGKSTSLKEKSNQVNWGFRLTMSTPV